MTRYAEPKVVEQQQIIIREKKIVEQGKTLVIINHGFDTTNNIGFTPSILIQYSPAQLSDMFRGYKSIFLRKGFGKASWNDIAASCRYPGDLSVQVYISTPGQIRDMQAVVPSFVPATVAGGAPQNINSVVYEAVQGLNVDEKYNLEFSQILQYGLNIVYRPYVGYGFPAGTATYNYSIYSTLIFEVK